MAKAQETKAVAPKKAAKKVIENIKIENAFRRINVPAKAVVFVLEPGQVKSAEMETFLRSQGFEIKPVIEVTNGEQIEPREMALSFFDQISLYSPDIQNAILKIVYTALFNNRKEENDKAYQQYKDAEKNIYYANNRLSDLLYISDAVLSDEDGASIPEM